jgi:hypothetical protein
MILSKRIDPHHPHLSSPRLPSPPPPLPDPNDLFLPALASLLSREGQTTDSATSYRTLQLPSFRPPSTGAFFLLGQNLSLVEMRLAGAVEGAIRVGGTDGSNGTRGMLYICLALAQVSWCARKG